MSGTASLRRSPTRGFKATLGLPRELLLGRLAYSLKRTFFALPNFNLGLIGSAPAAIKLAPPDPWPGNAAFGTALARGLFSFAGRSIDQPAPLWRPLGADTEWLDELHGFAWLRDLRAAGGDGGRQAARELVNSWIRHNSRWSSIAWNPVITGLRLANWLGQYEFYAASADLPFRRKVLTSATRQARHLGRVLPAGLSGSELIAALKGLIYAGICLPGGGIWLDKGVAMLCQEIERQILPDGGHIERSPARQLSVLRDVIDLRAALNAAGLQVPEVLQLAIEAMAPFLRLLQHGDGGLGLFNEGTEEEGWRVDMVLQRAGGKRAQMDPPQGGFQRLQAGRSIILADAAGPPPPGYDAHAHAGTLSFEMSVGRERLIVNCGAHSGRPDWRLAQRSTAAHSTLSLNDTNSSEVFDGAGLGRRPSGVTCQRNEDQGNHWLEMSHDGFVASFGLIHQRRLFLAANGDDVRGEDCLIFADSESASRDPSSFQIRFHLHPNVQATVAQAGDSVFLRTAKGSSWRLRAAGASLHLEPSVYLGYVGDLRRCQQVVLRGSAAGPETVVKWALRREGGK